MGLIWNNTDLDDGMKSELWQELLYRRYTFGITDIDEYGCEVTDDERIALFGMKRRILRRMIEVLDEEIKACVYEIKTGEFLNEKNGKE